MIPPRFRIHWPLLASRLQNISEETLSEPLGETAIGMAMACAQWRYDQGTLFLHALQARERAPRPERWEKILAEFRAVIRIDALRLPPVGLEEGLLASPRLIEAARAAA